MGKKNGKPGVILLVNVPISGCLLELAAAKEAQTMQVTAQVSSPSEGSTAARGSR